MKATPSTTTAKGIASGGKAAADSAVAAVATAAADSQSKALAHRAEGYVVPFTPHGETQGFLVPGLRLAGVTAKTAALPATTVLQQDPEEYYALLKQNIQMIQNPPFPQIHLKHQGSLCFDFGEVGGGPGGGQMEASCEVIVLDHYPVNAYWILDFSESGGGTPPDCLSLDDYEGINRNCTCHPPRQLCATCPHNQWQTDEQGNVYKECNNRYRLFVLYPGQILPVMIDVGPTSRRPIQRFFTGAMSSQHPYLTYVTRLELEEGRGTFKHSILRPGIGRQLQYVEYAAARRLRADFLPHMRRKPVISDTPAAATPNGATPYGAASGDGPPADAPF